MGIKTNQPMINYSCLVVKRKIKKIPSYPLRSTKNDMHFYNGSNENYINNLYKNNSELPSIYPSTFWPS